MRKIALTPGCIHGIGPELFPLALQRVNVDVDTQFIWCGTRELYVKHARGWKLDIEAGPKMEFYNSSPEHALLDAIDLAKQKKIDAIVTGPARKASVVDHEGNRYGGQTELLYRYLGDGKGPPLMCFGGYHFWLALATIHVPIKHVAEHITVATLVSHIKRLSTLGSHIAVLGLNPHAGENGLIGDEEIRIIKPAIELVQQTGLHIEGPLPADGFFGNLYRQAREQMPNAVIAMTHDQGLGPYKILCQGRAINTTLGLTIIRTSPAHGTADELVGRYTADPSSLIAAIELASNKSPNDNPYYRLEAKSRLLTPH